MQIVALRSCNAADLAGNGRVIIYSIDLLI